MNKGSGSSTYSRKCIVCGKQTGSYLTWYENGIEISIPVCEKEEFLITGPLVDNSMKSQLRSIRTLLNLSMIAKD